MTTTAMSSIHPNNGMKSGKKSNGRSTYKIARRGIAFSFKGTRLSNNNRRINGKIVLIL